MKRLRMTCATRLFSPPTSRAAEPMGAVNIIQIVVSVILIAVILIQVKGQGSGFFGAAESSYHTRRGVEKTLFQFTIFMVVVFIGMSILSVRFI